MIPPGFEHLYPLGPPTSAGLTKPNPQPGLKIEAQELPSDEPAPESHSEPKLSAKARVGKPGTSRKRAAVGKSSEVKDEIALLNGMIRFADKYKCSFWFLHVEMDKSIVAVDESHRRNESVASGSKCSGSLVPINSIAIDINCAEEEIDSPKHEHFSIRHAASAGGPSLAEILSLDDVSINRTKILMIGAYSSLKRGRGNRSGMSWKAEYGVHLKMTELIRTKTDVLINA